MLCDRFTTTNPAESPGSPAVASFQTVTHGSIGLVGLLANMIPGLTDRLPTLQADKKTVIKSAERMSSGEHQEAGLFTGVPPVLPYLFGSFF